MQRKFYQLSPSTVYDNKFNPTNALTSASVNAMFNTSLTRRTKVKSENIRHIVTWFVRVVKTLENP